MTRATTLVSADSHVIEPVALWHDALPPTTWGDAPSTFSQRPGGFDPKARLDEMEMDTVSAEVLYPSLALKLFSLDDSGTQEAAFRLYNDWLADYCSVAGDRLVGIAAVSTYDIDHAVAETRRCRDAGLGGILVWQTPHPDLPFAGRHYDPLWSVCQELGLPVSLHILTGFDYSREIYRQGSSLTTSGIPMYRLSINQKLLAVMDSLLDIVLSGILDRFPDLRLVLVENEASWLPFFADQCDYYYRRFEDRNPVQLRRNPSEYFSTQVFTTFFRDPNVSLVVGRLGPGNLMWSSDYPHGNSTWPNSRQVVEERLGTLERRDFDRLAYLNACDLYGLDADGGRP
jgi:predicted TIM-barrel fold metal-dependent hydrolase